MAGSLIKVDEFTISSAVASVTLGGGSSGSSGLNASIDSTYDVYQLIISNAVPATNGQSLRMRVTKGGSVQSDSNYDEANKGIRSDQYSWNDQHSTDQTYWNKIGAWSTSNASTEAGASGNAIVYLFNFANASEYSFITVEGVGKWSSGLIGIQGGGTHTVESASDGVNLFFSTGNIASGKFSLYGLKK